MNRRDFTRSLAALGLTPMLPPLPAAAAPTAASAFTPYMYGLGAHMARSAGTSSPALLAVKLHLTPNAAFAMQAQLVKNGIVSAPNAAGVAVATQPYMAANTLGNEVKNRALRKLMDKTLEDPSDDVQPIADDLEDQG